MNFAHLHLILNHIPVIGIPFLTLFLIFAYIKKNEQTKKFSLVLFCLIGLVVLPVFFTGEPAADLIEDFPGVTEEIIRPHEEMGEKSLVICLLAAGFAVSALAISKNEKLNQKLVMATIGLAVFGSMSLLYTANLGGQIRHTENRSPLFKSVNQ